MIKIAVVGCTGKLGSVIIQNIAKRTDVTLRYAIARKGNPFVGEFVTDVIGVNCDIKRIDDIEEALLKANSKLDDDKVSICSVRGGSIFGEHEVILAKCKDEVMTYKHQVSSREPFAEGAIDVAIWIVKQKNGVYGMDDFAEELKIVQLDINLIKNRKIA